MWQMFFRNGVTATAGLLALPLLLAACGSSEPAADCGGLEAADAWVQPAHAGSREMTGYFRLDNRGSSAVVINGVSSSQFGRAVFQDKSADNEQKSKQGLDRIKVPAGQTVEFSPGAREVALYSPTQGYDAGDQVEIVLACGREQASLPVKATVRHQDNDGPEIDADGEAAKRARIISDSKDGGGAGAADDSKTAD